MAKEKAVSEAVAIDTTTATRYAVLIEAGESANLEALNFIVDSSESMKAGITEAVMKESMKSVLKDVNIAPVVRPSHVPAMRPASLIIKQFEGEISEIKASKVLSLAVRVINDVKASGAKKHIESFDTFAELDEGTKTKAESQARDKQESNEATIAETSKDVSLEAVIDGVLQFVGNLDLRSATTKERKKLDTLVSKLITISTNTKATEKVNA